MATTKQYYNCIKGKSVVVVGPAHYLAGSGQGALIDSYDLIVRLNSSFPLPAGLKKHIGSRTDIIYHVGKNHDKILNSQDIDIMLKDGIGWFVSKHNESNKRTKYLGMVLNGRVPWITISKGFRRRIKDKMAGSPPNIGMIAVTHLLASKIKELHVTGFDFYRTKDHYYPGHVEEYKYIIQKGINATAPQGKELKVSRHRQDRQMKYFAGMLKGDKRLSADENIMRLLKEDRLI